MLGGGLKYFLCSTLPGEMIPIWLAHIFQMGWFNHQPVWYGSDIICSLKLIPATNWVCSTGWFLFRPWAIAKLMFRSDPCVHHVPLISVIFNHGFVLESLLAGGRFFLNWPVLVFFSDELKPPTGHMICILGPKSALLLWSPDIPLFADTWELTYFGVN